MRKLQHALMLFRRNEPTEWVHLFTVQEGKIVQLRHFCDTATVAAAFR
ncbi:MAG: hypothetical protein KA314_26415 [Chloroflexi bacterium]|nr:hypothetical protein [Chloroflexota bacterium]MBP8059384.1 hypothetical protein [Chloroflexota bacterium]